MKKFFQSLNFKLGITIILFALIPLAFTSLFFFSKTETSITTEQKKSVDRQLALVNENIDSVFSSLLDNVSGLASSALLKQSDSSITSYVSNSGTTAMTPSKNGTTEKAIFDSFKTFGETHPNYQYVYMGTENGGYIQYPEGNMDGAYDPRARPWYPVATSTPDKAVLGKPYYFATDNIVIVGGSQAIKDASGKVIGVMALDMSVDTVTKLFKEASKDFYGYFMLIGKDGTIIADPSNKDNNFKNIKEVYGEQLAGLVSTGANYTDLTLNNHSYLIKSLPSTSTGWTYVALVDKAAMLSTMSALQQILMLTVIIVAVLAILIGYFVSSQIVRPIRAVVKSANKVADGDFNVTITTRASGEAGLLVDSFKRIGATLLTYQTYIEEITSVLNQIAEGNIAFKLHSDYIGEFGKIKDSLINISQTLTETLTQIKSASSEIALGSDQIASGAQALAQGATEQASTIEEFSTSLSDVSEKTKQNAGRAAEASRLSQEMGNEIENSNHKMERMTDAMRDISDKSNQIRNIIKTIDDIAFQTNILALNAAVEAARAGQAGKGFAVVADEVRNLAQRSADAARSTTELIESTISAVRNGDRITEETAKSLHAASDKAIQTSTIITQIADASQEQSSSLSQITVGIDQFTAVVQMNSATAEESSASSEQLTNQALTMKGLVEQFKLAGDKGAGNPRQLGTPRY